MSEVQKILFSFLPDMTAVGDFLIDMNGSLTYRELRDLRKYWPGNTFPVAVPTCGFKGEKCMKKLVEDTNSKNSGL